MSSFSAILRALADHHHHVEAGQDGTRDAQVFDVLGRLVAGLAANTTALNALKEKIDRMSNTLDTGLATLDTTVAGLTTEVGSAVALMDGIAGYVAEAVKKDQAAGAAPEQLAHVSQLVSDIGALKDKLAASILKNTPSDPAPAASEDPPPVPGDTPPVPADPVAPAVASDPVTGAPLPQPQTP